VLHLQCLAHPQTLSHVKHQLELSLDLEAASQLVLSPQAASHPEASNLVAPGELPPLAQSPLVHFPLDQLSHQAVPTSEATMLLNPVSLPSQSHLVVSR